MVRKIRSVLLDALDLLGKATEGGRMAGFATRYLPKRRDHH